MTAFIGTVTFLPLFLQLVTGVAPTLSGLLLVPQSLSLMAASVFVGRKVARTGRYKRYPVIGAVLLPVSVALLATLTQHTPLYLVALYMVLLGAGMGLILTVIVVAVQNAVAQRDMGTATASYMFFRSIGSAFGAAVYGTILNARLRYWLPRLLPHGTHLSASSLSYSPAAVRHLPVVVRTGVIDAFSRSLHVVFLVGAPVVAIALPLLLMMKELPLRTVAHIEGGSAAAAAEAVSPGPDRDPPESTEAAKLGDDRSGRFRRGKEASGRRLGRSPAGGP
jgi:MFS family permease